MPVSTFPDAAHELHEAAASDCPRMHGEVAPVCSQKLQVADCVAQWRREARQGSLHTGRYRCRYFQWGQGPPLVFVPGLNSDGESFLLPMARLKEHFCCIGYDLPSGAGDGAAMRNYRHDDLAADLFALLDHLQISRCQLLGYSFGSTVVLRAASLQPQRLRRLILLSGFVRRRLSPAEVFLAKWARYLPGLMGCVPGMEWLTRQSQAIAFCEAPAANWQYLLDRQACTPLAAFAQRALWMHALDLRPMLPSIRTPALLVTGDTDSLVSAAALADLRAGLPHALHAEIEHCGHQAHLSHPEVLAELLVQFAR